MLFHCLHQDAFDIRCDSRDSPGFIASLTVSDLGADITWAVVAVGGHRDEVVRTHFLSGKLVFDEQFAGHVDDPLVCADADPGAR